MIFMLMAWEYDTDHAAFHEGIRHPRVQRHVEALTRLVQRQSASGAAGLVLEFGLTPEAKTFRRKDGKPLVLDGPFAETKEQLAGVDIIDFPSRAEALDYTRDAFAHESHVTEIRPVLELYWIQSRGPRLGSRLFALLMRGDEARNTPGVADQVLEQHTGVTMEYIAQRGWLEPYVWGGVRLQPSAQATSVRLQGGNYVAADGPFAETREVIGGVTILESASMDEALDWARKYAPRDGDVIEAREIAGGPLLFCHS
jgi:hypothetical protein